MIKKALMLQAMVTITLSVIQVTEIQTTVHQVYTELLNTIQEIQ